MTTRVLIADDSHLFGDALELILEADERIQVVGRAIDGAQAVTLARELDPDVVLLDISMPGVSAFEAIEAMIAHEAGRRVLVVTGSDDPADREKARLAGAVGYLTKENIADELVPGVLEAAR
jgi:DNA-binding NarL/FixJ family response regulator